MKIMTIVGARPQFVKVAPLRPAIENAGHRETLVHTGQHYDHNLSQIFFDEMAIPAPDIHLGIGSASHGRQTGEMLIGLEQVIMEQSPDWVIVIGDTNTTLAGAVAAAKLQVPIAHLEAGLRSYNREMPEEHNRVLADHSADVLLCPTKTAVDNLAAEGLRRGVHLVGDIMYDALRRFAPLAQARSRIMDQYSLVEEGFLLATIHRPGNTDHQVNLRHILSALEQTGETVVFPVHPRTFKYLTQEGLVPGLPYRNNGILFIEPVGYLDMLRLLAAARLVLTDSGGLQKEAYWMGKPCLTLRAETEWVETVQVGWNVLVGADPDKILHYAQTFAPPVARPDLFGDGLTAGRCVTILENGARL